MLAVHPRFHPDRTRSCSTETDVLFALKKLGHAVRIVAMEENFKLLERELSLFNPHIVFNLMEEFRSEAIYDFHLVSFLEALGVPYTGCNPRGLIISRNKLWVSHLAGSLGLNVPQGGLHAQTGNLSKIKKTACFVKFNREHASLGIDRRNRVTSKKELSLVVSRLQSLMKAEILVQEFIEGAEISVSVWGNRKARSLPPWQLHLQDPQSFATQRVKFSAKYRHKRGIRASEFRGVESERLRNEAVRLFEFIDLSGYARFDFRLTSEGTPFLIDVNPNPNLSRSEDFAGSARRQGFEYTDLIAEILRLGFNYKPKR